MRRLRRGTINRWQRRHALKEVAFHIALSALSAAAYISVFMASSPDSHENWATIFLRSNLSVSFEDLCALRWQLTVAQCCN
jgi:hypothetical protein